VLAEQLAVQAQLDPERFATLAREHSEDPLTRQLGGSLGGVKASYFAPLYGLLDVFAATEIGSVSQVVETPHGFHVFLRRHPPSEAVVSGSRIVIGHVDAGWLGILYPDRPPTRSRDEAAAIASQIYEQARLNPERFDELVRRHSEHEDVIRDGDFGTWSNLEPTPFPREIEALERVKPGEVAQPIDSLFGIQVILRTPNRPRTVYATTTLRLRFDPSAPGSKAATLDRARSIASRVAQSPASFTELQAELCSRVSDPARWHVSR
jgi:hypothetical protein